MSRQELFAVLNRIKVRRVLILSVVVLGLMTLTNGIAAAHCDTLDGPVVKEARAALDTGDVTPLLKWVTKENEEEIKAAFKRTVSIRGKGGEVKEVADTWFLETLVRIHRAGEGAPYTGLKPAGTKLPHAVVAADKALDGGVSIDKVAEHVSAMVADGIKKRFTKAAERRKHMADSVQAGREYVEAYVDYIHFVEGIALKAEGGSGHHGEEKAAPEGGHHH